MRLLMRTDAGGVTFTRDLSQSELRRFDYAILSHTWGSAEEEIMYEDILKGEGTSKPGIGSEKMRFCVEQAAQDGLEYFWVDTCCINKKDDAELSKSLRSMFRWYAEANRCYVFLSDVLQGKVLGADWEHDFRRSRWFRRGWTLQELIAPATLEFYARSGKRLGTKASLHAQIVEITGIPAKALSGQGLASFTTHERRQWQEGRECLEPEDLAYSLLGLLDVSMPVLYGEGLDKAQQRLEKEIVTAQKGPRHGDFSIPFGDRQMKGVEKLVGRANELDSMHDKLVGNRTQRNTVILSGLGGIGKTQLAVAYAKRHKDSYSAVFWFNMRDEASAKQSFVATAQRILQYHPSAAHLSSVHLTGSLDEVTGAVLAWLGDPDNHRWLAIYDNYDNPKVPGNSDSEVVDIDQFLPDADQGSVIITTRSTQVKDGRGISVPKLASEQDSVDILSNVSGRKLSMKDRDVAALVKKLDGLPLALATTGSFLEQASISVGAYLQLYETSWAQLHEKHLGIKEYADRADRTLYSTWRISFDRIQQQNEVAANLLILWCYFSNQDLWYELLCDGDSQDLPWLRTLAGDKLGFISAMRLLCNYGLAENDVSLTADTNSGGYSIHPCVHSWTIHVLNKQWDGRLADFAVSAVGQHVPRETAPEPWTTQRRLIQHADRCLQYLSGLELVDSETAYSSLHDMGRLYDNQGWLEKAEQMYLRALQGKEEAWGPKHTSTLGTVNNLGILYWKQGKMREAEEMYLRALQGFEEAWGPKHTSTLETVNNLGILYSDQGKMREAEEMYLRALQGFEEAWGPKHTSTLDTVNNLGLLYQKQGKMREAEEMYLRALQGFEEAQGPKHTSTLDTVNNLGILYCKQGKMREAEEMYLRALQGKEEAWGPKHTSTLDTAYNLGNLYFDQRRSRKAKDIYQRALQGYQCAEGDHKADIEYIQDQLKALSVGDQTQYPNAELKSQSQPDKHPAKPAGHKIARVRTFALRMFHLNKRRAVASNRVFQ
ncbi:hypothetical protein LTR78_010910 [Recurvomyces mirabilis]|uniref:Heterokaryon incompatibility domain-containing protein n=1 Tax=Recurvomyces mirabilis TaxID=574656 RepID=A0AAE0TPK9_9PEZI|nr:hypothetical protein LTR78_010910 [Recurvomyces mirabilis]